MNHGPELLLRCRRTPTTMIGIPRFAETREIGLILALVTVALREISHHVVHRSAAGEDWISLPGNIVKQTKL